MKELSNRNATESIEAVVTGFRLEMGGPYLMDYMLAEWAKDEEAPEGEEEIDPDELLPYELFAEPSQEVEHSAPEPAPKEVHLVRDALIGGAVAGVGA